MTVRRILRHSLRAAVLAVVLPGAGFAADSARPSRPNVVLIVSDDLSRAMGCYGDAAAITPHVDALARQGVVFKRAYCQLPVCNPSRSSMLSGLRPETTGVLTNGGRHIPVADQPPLLPRFFKNHGYTTICASKVFHGDTVTRGGKVYKTTDDPEAWDILEKELPASNVREMLEAGEAGQRLLWSGKPLDGDEAATPDGHAARRAAQLIMEHAGSDRPMFVAVGLRRPHFPWEAPRRYFEMHPPEKMPLAEHSTAHVKALPPWSLGKVLPGHPQTPEERQRAMSAFYACVSFMDAQVGVIVEALEKAKLRENTIILFVSDNGFHLGEHGMWGKDTLFEDSAGVPLVIAAPGMGKGESRRTVELIDLYPTLADLCGLGIPTGLEGASLRPLLADPNAPWDRPAYTVLRRGDVMGRAVRTERFAYIEWNEGRSGLELYDHATDPREERNLAADPAHAETREKLRALLHRGKR